MNEKTQELIMDAIEEGYSSCCGASVALDICMECKEHCSIINEENDTLSKN